MGDPPNVVVGNKLQLLFNSFLYYNGPLVVCFLLPVAIFVQYWRFRKVCLALAYDQALVSLKVKETVDAEGWCTKAVDIEGG